MLISFDLNSFLIVCSVAVIWLIGMWLDPRKMVRKMLEKRRKDKVK